MGSDDSVVENAGEQQFSVEQPTGQEPKDDVACADCGAYRELVGPVSLDGEKYDGGDWVCRGCAESRGVLLN